MSENKSPAVQGRANLEWYRKAAKKKLKLLRAERPSARLAEALLAVAREHQFSSWRALKVGIEAAAVNGASQAVIAQLLRAGGDPRLKAADGRTALDLAKAKGKTRVLEQLKQWRPI